MSRALTESEAGKLFRRCVLTAVGCLEWQGACNSSGYGQIRINGALFYTHRLAVEATQGAIPKGMQVDHLCRNPICCNPMHLEVVTPAENTRRGLKGPRTVCIRGHAFTPENTYRRPDTGSQQCRQCATERRARR